MIKKFQRTIQKLISLVPLTQKIKNQILIFAILQTSIYSAVQLKAEDFSIITLPDTQNYTKIPANFKHFENQIQWIIKNKNKENIVFISHLGDVISNKKGYLSYFCPIYKYFNAKIMLPQYSKASNLFYKLDNNEIPYSVVPGNHDYDCIEGPVVWRGTWNFKNFFGADRYKDKKWFLDHDISERNMVQKFSVNGQDFLHIGMEYKPSDKAIKFAQEIIIQNINIPVIITTHHYLEPGDEPRFNHFPKETPNSSGKNNPEQLFKKLIEPFPQVFLVLSGHIHGNGYLESKTLLNKKIHQIVANYQSDPNGGNGWMNILKFSPNESTIDIKIISPSFESSQVQGENRAKDIKNNIKIENDINTLRDFLKTNDIKYYRQGQILNSGNKYYSVVDKYIAKEKNLFLFFKEQFHKIKTNKKKNLNIKSSLKSNFEDIVYFFDSFTRYILNKEDIYVSNINYPKQGLLKFENIIGFSKDQIPPNAKIQSAILSITSEGLGENLSEIAIHKMQFDWDETTKWDNFINGISIGRHAKLKPDAIIKKHSHGTNSYEITDTVQNWVNGEKNNGWVFISQNSKEWSLRSSEWHGIVERPMLTVIYKKN